MTYDTWKCTDPEMERAGRAEAALDAYEQGVWDEIVEMYESQHGEEVPRGIFEDARDQMYDWMCDEVHPKDAAEMILEEYNGD